MYRGLIHFHSSFSYDSLLSIKNIVNFALKNNLNFLILTDHDTINGSIALKDYIDNNNYNIEVLISAEYNTEYGDIIALNINKEIVNMKFDLFVSEVKEQNGLLLFPHPYKGHKHIDYISTKVDLIEVFNARTDDVSNEKAYHLAENKNIRKYYSADAHNYASLKNSIIEFKNKGSLIESLTQSEIKQVSRVKSYYIEIIYSQFIKAIKLKNLSLLKSLMINLIINTIKFKILRKV
jgi:predicted metal-dependent phosphoesterase TrpH